MSRNKREGKYAGRFRGKYARRTFSLRRKVCTHSYLIVVCERELVKTYSQLIDLQSNSLTCNLIASSYGITRLTSLEAKEGYIYDAYLGYWEESDDLFRNRVTKIITRMGND